MRLCVSYVYWTLLLVSVVSSGLLFIIVASEGIELSEKAKSIGQEGKSPLEDDGEESSSRYSEPLDNTISDLRSRPTVKTEKEHLHPVESNEEVSGHEAVKKESDGENNLNFLKQSLTSQPNLSQGISETGQAVVLTLVDTAAAELQSLAEPRLSSDIRSKSLTKNTTLRATTTDSIPVATTTTTTTTTATTPTTATTSRTTSSSLTHDELSEQTVRLTSSSQPVELAATASSSNVTKVPSIKEDTTESPATLQDLENKVPIVRAEQKPFDETTATKPEEIQPLDDIKDESVGREENSTAWAESDDGWTREKLVGGSGEELSNVISDDPVTSKPTDDHHEDMPSFSEWAQKRLEEAEKKKTHPNASVQNPGGPGRGLGSLKVRSKNYASPDCGAKIVAVNPEARSARSVLVSTRDEYMLNTCTSRIWFVVELCEAIQAKKIELANFELFSSSPKDFSVYVSDRFPTRDWSPVGQFTAKDERDIQSFQLHPHLFGKFIKVETHSHHGSEHFCPISLFRAYGTSEFEVLETETDHQEIEDNESNEDDEDEPLDPESDVETRNLFGSARDAVLRIVKKAAEVLVKASDLSNKNNITKIQESIEGSIKDDSFVSCMTPRYTINCANCTDNRFAGVFELLNCRAGQLDEILRNPFVNETLRGGEVCASYGLDTANATHDEDTLARNFRDDEIDESSKTREFLLGRNSRLNFLTSIYSPEYIVALCNVIATKERRLVLNTSYELSGNLSENSSTRIDTNGANFETLEANVQSRVTTSTCLPETDANGCKNIITSRETKTSRIQGALEQESSTSSSGETTTASSESLASQIKPTKALSREDMRKESSLPILEPSKDPNEESVQAEVLTTASPSLNAATATSRIVEEPPAIQTPVEATIQIATTVVAPSNTAGRESQDSVSGHENSHENGGTPMRQDNNDQEYKSGKSESNEQEAKFIAQDQMSLDSILSDLKDLETDGAAIHGNSNLNANVVAQPTTSSTPQQKESVFLRLSNRIKALERNMSLSGQYLEELSKRYKKQVEEMQRSLERATAAMSEESRKGEERELRRIEEISALRDEITSLTKSMEILLYDRNSWRSKLSTVCQHFALVVVEIVVFIFVVSYCRRNSEFEDIDENVSSADNEVTRRRSAGAMTSCGATRKTKKRRPSEIASRIGGTYRELMIDDHRSSHETKKDKKKRRKRELNGRALNGDSKKETMSLENDIPGGTALPSRRSSSTDSTSCHVKQLELCHKRKRPDSAPEYSGVWIDSSIIEKRIDENIEIIDDSKIEKTNVQRSLVDDTSRTNFPTDNRIVDSKEHSKTTGGSFFRGGSILKAARLSSPSFMKTALGSRSKRNAKQSEKIDNVIEMRSEDWEWYSKSSSNRSDSGSPSSLRVDGIDSMSNGQDEAATKNGHNRNTSNESESGSSTTATSTKKEKKTGQGLRKMCEGRKTLEMLDVRHSQRVVGL